MIGEFPTRRRHFAALVWLGVTARLFAIASGLSAREEESGNCFYSVRAKNNSLVCSQFGDEFNLFLAGSSTLSIRASAAVLLSSITSEISHISSFLARYSVSRSCGARVLVPLNCVNDSTMWASSKMDPEQNSFRLSSSRWRQFLAVPGSLVTP